MGASVLERVWWCLYERLSWCEGVEMWWVKEGREKKKRSRGLLYSLCLWEYYALS